VAALPTKLTCKVPNPARRRSTARATPTVSSRSARTTTSHHGMMARTPSAMIVAAMYRLSDWLDGKIARAFNQGSRLGEVLDPAADRLYIAATIIALGVRAIIPWWLIAVLALRELTVGVALVVLRRRTGFGTLQVSFVGKAATLCLLYAFPLLFLGDHPGWGWTLARVLGWAFATWGTALYWWAAMLYLIQVRSLVSDTASSLGTKARP
jgi:cardiolipin synthase (CMP-forming)